VGYHPWKVCESEVDLGMKMATKDVDKVMEGCERMKGRASTRERLLKPK
jgi:hypothetical protein